jgi:NADH dehydrogenase
MQRILVLGAGFAGLWSALGAARELDARGVGPGQVEILVVDRRPVHSIRVRNYEADLASTIIPLADVLDPVGVRHLAAEISDIDVTGKTVTCGSQTLPYDRLVFALGSRLARPPVPGLDTAFDIDTYEAARRLEAHIAALPARPASPGRDTVLIVGAGLTGIELAAEMPGKLRAAFRAGTRRVILADHEAWIGSNMGDAARPVIATALQSLDVETRTGVSVAAIDAGGATLTGGERIEAETVVWCAGMQADPLTAKFPVTRDRSGRLPVDRFLRIVGRTDEFAAGDSAWLPIDGTHASVMSCQHARPMGRYAGHNVVCDLLDGEKGGGEQLALDIPRYVTILDLGPWGGVYTEGWDRKLFAQGQAAKQTKTMINRVRIYPPLDGNRRAILDAAAPEVQALPVVTA